MKYIVPLYQAYKITGDKTLLDDAIVVFEQITSHYCCEDLYGAKYNTPYNRSHYHAYVMYGLIYFHKWTNRKDVLEKIDNGIDFLMSMVSKKGGVYSNYSKDGLPIVKSGYDIPVTAQLAELILYRKNILQEKDNRYESILYTLENFIKNKLIISKLNSKICGGLPFLEKGHLLPYAVPWGVEFSVNYIYDKKLMDSEFFIEK